MRNGEQFCNELLAVFFVVCRLTVACAIGTLTAIKTVRGNKNPIQKGNCPRFFEKGVVKKVFPERGAGVGSVRKRVV